MTTSPTVHVELMRTLDEKFIADPVAYATMRPTAALVIDGAELRDATGRLDPARVAAFVERATWLFPPMRLRLRPMPLGVTTPAWVAAEEVDLAYHVRVLAEPPDPQDAALAGQLNGDLDIARPLWSVLVFPLAGGGVAVVPQIQHALGDGLFGLRVIDALTENEPFDVDEPVDRTALRSPRTAAAILATAFGAWWRRQGGPRTAWREYTRKSFRRRMRRMAGRIRRSAGLGRRMPTRLPARRHARVTFPLADVKSAARALGASVHDLTIAIAFRGIEVSGATGEAERLALMVPISRRAGSTGDERNNISMVRITVQRGQSLGAIAAAVHEQLARAVAGEDLPMPAVQDWPGYASFLPWRPRRRFLGSAPVRSAVLWPVLGPLERIGVFGSSYHDVYTLTVSASADLDIEAVLAEAALHLPAREAAS